MDATSDCVIETRSSIIQDSRASRSELQADASFTEQSFDTVAVCPRSGRWSQADTLTFALFSHESAPRRTA